MMRNINETVNLKSFLVNHPLFSSKSTLYLKAHVSIFSVKIACYYDIKFFQYIIIELIFDG